MEGIVSNRLLISVAIGLQCIAMIGLGRLLFETKVIKFSEPIEWCKR